jgi:hypothetical protein
VILSTILFRSKQPKYASLDSQHFARCVRSGAIGAPSEEIFGGGGDAGEELKSPIAAAWSLGKVKFEEDFKKISNFIHLFLHIHIPEVSLSKFFKGPKLVKNQLTDVLV